MSTTKRANSGVGVKFGCAVAVALAVVSRAPQAHAHGGFPRAFEIVVEPGDPKDVLLRSDLWGFFRTRDGGQTWQWTCSEVYGASSLSVNHSNFVIAPGGRVLVANAFKGLRMTDDMCNWTEVSDLHGELVEDIVISSTTLFVLTSTYKAADSGTGGGIDGTLWQSKDNGDHFARTASALPSTFAGSSLRFAPSDPKRTYVAGRILEQSGGTMQRSDDGGATWKSSSFPVTDDNMALRIAGVHPTRPDVVFVWADLAEGLGQDSKDEIWATGDGGKTWSSVYKGAGDLPGFAFSPDGTEVAIAGPIDGVRRGKLDDVLGKGPSAFSQESTGKVWGLHWTDAGFTAGTDNFTGTDAVTGKTLPAFTYGTSLDEGKSFQPDMSICDLKFGSCGASSTVATACTKVYDDPAGGFLQDFTAGPRCVGTGGSGNTGGAKGTDGGTDVAKKSTSSNGGCAFSVSSKPRGKTGAGILAFALSLLGLRVLRRPRS
jgi:hypothetical protein